jgi:hypothetical protein
MPSLTASTAILAATANAAACGYLGDFLGGALLALPVLAAPLLLRLVARRGARRVREEPDRINGACVRSGSTGSWS